MNFIGNIRAKTAMERFSKADNFPHTLLTGPSGHGKTTLVRLAAPPRPILEINGTVIKDNDALVACIKEVTHNSVLFIDEIHELSDLQQTALYGTMETGIFQIVLKKKLEPIQLPSFTLVGATTHEHLLNTAFKNRFLTIPVESYSFNELVDIAKFHLPNVNPEVYYILAEHCRNVPRILVQYCKTMRDVMKGRTAHDARELLNMLNVYPDGLSKTELKILNILEDGKTISLSAISAILRIEEEAVKQEHEPYLIEKQFIERSRAGRSLTEKGKDYLNNLRLPSFYLVTKVA